MKASTVFMILGTLGAGVAIGDKLSSFGGNRGIAQAPTQQAVLPAGVSAMAPQGGFQGTATATSEAIRQEEESKIKKAISLIDEMAASDLEKNLASSLGGDSIGQQVARGLIAGRHQEIPGASEIYNQFLTQLRADPKSGMDVVREAMRRIPEKDFEADRTTLLQTAASLNGMESEARELALRELTANIVEVPRAEPGAPAADPANANANVLRASLVATAHKVFLDLTQDADQAYAGTIQGILSQPDSALRRTLIDKFLGKFPDRREPLQQELAARQVDPYVGGLAPQTAPAAGVVVQAQMEAPPAEAIQQPQPIAESAPVPGDALQAQPN